MQGDFGLGGGARGAHWVLKLCGKSDQKERFYEIFYHTMINSKLFVRWREQVVGGPALRNRSLYSKNNAASGSKSSSSPPHHKACLPLSHSYDGAKIHVKSPPFSISFPPKYPTIRFSARWIILHPRATTPWFPFPTRKRDNYHPISNPIQPQFSKPHSPIESLGGGGPRGGAPSGSSKKLLGKILGGRNLYKTY